MHIMKHLLSLLLFLGVSYTLAELDQSKLEKYQNVRYLAFTKENQLQYDDIRDVDCSGNSTTVFIVHGFFKISLKEPLELKNDIFMHNPDVRCVVVVSWLQYSTFSGKSSFGDKSSNYHIISKKHLPNLAQDINEKLQYIQQKGVTKIELIGHSIGAHAVGQAARHFKQNTGHEVDRIVGLDPAARFFKDNPHLKLKQTDAKSVAVFHTNAGHYGLSERIGPNDVYINGGEQQPECKRKLTDNICSHNRGWDAYSKHLKNNTNEGKTIKRLLSNRFVLCIDVSGSMDQNNRLIRAISAGKKLFSTIKLGSYMGIVTFSNTAEISHDIIQIKGDMDRQSLISKLPTGTVASTSIGAGLNASMNLLQNLPQSEEFCSTIILLSDGMQNVPPTPTEILPELQKSCIGVNSVAIGASASGDLEIISSQTGGSVIYAMENGNAQQIIDTERAFSFSYENEMDADIRPIYLPTKQVTLGGGESVIKFVIDKNIGKDTEFTFTSDNINHFDVTLTSPTGKTYTSASPEYIDDTSNLQKIYKIPLADPGTWNMVVNNVLRARRSIRSTSTAIVTVKSHPLDDAIPPIRLDATVSKRTLEYPKSNTQRDMEAARIVIYAELRRGRNPIIKASVLGHIEGLNEETVTFQLHDDGAFPDELANDGVYTASIIKLKQLGRYSVFVTASNTNETAKLLSKEIDYFEREPIDCDLINCEPLNDFQREAYVGSVKLSSTENMENIPPNPITDLRATVRNETERLIALEWTSPANEAFDMRVKAYDIRAIDGVEFERAFRFNHSHFVEEFTTEQREMYLLRIPPQIWKYDKKLDEPGFFLELKFAVKAIGTNDEISPSSNTASVVIKDKPVVLVSAHKVCNSIRETIPGVGDISIIYC